MTVSPAPGWYPDPIGTGSARWWDGAAWTEHVTPLPAAAPPIPAETLLVDLREGPPRNGAPWPPAPGPLPAGLGDGAPAPPPRPRVTRLRPPTAPRVVGGDAPPSPVSLDDARRRRARRRPRRWRGSVRLVLALGSVAGAGAASWFVATLVRDYREAHLAASVDAAPRGEGVEHRDDANRLAVRVLAAWPVAPTPDGAVASWFLDTTPRDVPDALTLRVVPSPPFDNAPGAARASNAWFGRHLSLTDVDVTGRRVLVGVDDQRVAVVRGTGTDSSGRRVAFAAWLHVADDRCSTAVLSSSPERLPSVLPFVEPFGRTVRTLRR